MQYILKTFPVSEKRMRCHSPPVLPSITNYA